MFLTVLSAPSWSSGGIRLDNGTLIIPEIYVGVGYEQNLALTKENQISSPYWQVTPSISALLSPGNATHKFNFLADITEYSQSGADNYEDFELTYEGSWEPTSRHRANWNLSQVYGHQQRGSQQTRFQFERFEEVLQFKQINTGVKYEFGSKVAKGRLGVRGGASKLEYTNFEDFTNQLNYNSQSLGGWFYYRVGNVTNLSFDVGYQSTDYYNEPDPSQSRNSEIYTLLTGMIWEGLAKTRGQLMVGLEQRKFDLFTRKDLNNLAIDAAIVWEPKTYSIVNLSISRRTTEGAAGSDATLVTEATVDWSHRWTENSYSRIGYEYKIRDEQGGYSRQDDMHYIFTKYNRSLNNWISIETMLSYLLNSSTDTFFDYDSQKLSIGLRVEI